MSTGYEAIDSHLFVRDGDELKPDPLADDLELDIGSWWPTSITLEILSFYFSVFPVGGVIIELFLDVSQFD